MSKIQQSTQSRGENGTGLFPISTVSKLTGVNSITLRAWERRYGLVNPERAVARREQVLRSMVRAGTLKPMRVSAEMRSTATRGSFSVCRAPWRCGSSPS